MLLFLPPNSPFPIDLPRCKSQRWIVQPSTQQIREPNAQAKRLVYHIAWFNFFYHATAERSYHYAVYVSWITTIELMHVSINRVSLRWIHFSLSDFKINVLAKTKDQRSTNSVLNCEIPFQYGMGVRRYHWRLIIVSNKILPHLKTFSHQRVKAGLY